MAPRRHRPLGVREKRQRAHRSAATGFYILAFCVFFLAVYSWIYPAPTRLVHSSHGAFSKRVEGMAAEENLECRLVHMAKDKCAFVKENCPDEEAGLFSYLRLYFCTLDHAQPLAFTILAFWLCLLFSTIGIAASDFFCINLSTIAQLLGLSESLAGVTFLAFGNGSPDVFSTFAAMSTNSGSLAVGELIGAASFITAVVAGAMAFVRPFKVSRKSFVRDVSFFIVAASFAMGFLWDGKLYLWEAAAMVGLYIFYVIFVVVWHWWFRRRKRRRQVEEAARMHFVSDGSDIAEFPAYHDDEEPEQTARSNQLSRQSTGDITLLERGPEADEDDDIAEEDRRKRELAELNDEMRLSRVGGLRRPGNRDRRSTHNPPVRPSLIGALEFRSVLSGLQRSGNMQSFQLLRRHSDDGRVDDGRSHDSRSMTSVPEQRTLDDGTASDVASQAVTDAAQMLRSRAISAPDPSFFRQAAQQAPSADLLGPWTSADSRIERQAPAIHLAVPTSPNLDFGSPSTSHHDSSAGNPRQLEIDSTLLAPPSQSIIPMQPSSDHGLANGNSRPSRPHVKIPSAPSPTPQYLDSGISPLARGPSIRLPTPSDGTTIDSRLLELFGEPAKPPRWWPSSVLPAPMELWSILCPTLCGWKDKNWWERLLGLAAAPSVFALTITLPVVESQGHDDDASVDEDVPDLTLPLTFERANTPAILVEDEDQFVDPMVENVNVATPFANGFAGHGTTATVAASSEYAHEHAYHDHLDGPEGPGLHVHHRHARQSSAQIASILSPTDRAMMQSPEQLPVSAKFPAAGNWNRWLVIVQIFMAPLLITLIIRVNLDPGDLRTLLRSILISLACSLAALAVILSTTTPTQAPKWRIGLCFLGFIVSICWISTIADEVVGVLKSIGVILNMSDAILGLTIFAVGNSLGDLVADYTVAKLGYPVMALSACFGGPMLNILLGVGLSGCYLTIKKARERQKHHPDSSLKLKPYHIKVSRTLVISGATLLITLVGLLIVVPLRRWKMDRVVGWALMMLWTISTIGNVLVEVLGVGKSWDV